MMSQAGRQADGKGGREDIGDSRAVPFCLIIIYPIYSLSFTTSTCQGK